MIGKKTSDHQMNGWGLPEKEIQIVFKYKKGAQPLSEATYKLKP